MVRALSSLLAATVLAGCVQPQLDPSATRQTGANAPAAFIAPGPSTRRIAVLLPLTGQNAPLGQDLLRAVQLALGSDGPQPDVLDTGGTPTGATSAAQKAVANGDAVIVGPLTAPETAAAAAVAPNIPILRSPRTATRGGPASGRSASRHSSR